MPQPLPAEDPMEGAFRYHEGRWVLPEAELAAIHGVTTARLLRCLEPYEPLPGELCTYLEASNLAPLGILPRRDGSAPLVFSESGALVAGCLLGSPAALVRSVAVARVFSRLRQSGVTPPPKAFAVHPMWLERNPRPRRAVNEGDQARYGERRRAPLVLLEPVSAK